MQKRISQTTKRTQRSKAQPKAEMAGIPPSKSHEEWLINWLKDRENAAAYLESAIEDGDQGVLMLALRHVAQAHGGVAAVAKKSKLTREATYRMLSKRGNPELRSLNAILAATGLRLSVQPVQAS